jgi:hypothetical protein
LILFYFYFILSSVISNLCFNLCILSLSLCLIQPLGCYTPIKICMYICMMDRGEGLSAGGDSRRDNWKGGEEWEGGKS